MISAERLAEIRSEIESTLSRHSPAPWHVVTGVFTDDVYGPEGDLLASVHPHVGSRDRLANATLVAAAPRLLRAARDLLIASDSAAVAESILRKLATGKRGMGNDFIDPERGIVDATAELSPAEIDYLRALVDEVGS